MRYKEHPSIADKCLQNIADTFGYYRKRPIAVAGLCVVFLWILAMTRWTKHSTDADAYDDDVNRHSMSKEIQLEPHHDQPVEQHDQTRTNHSIATKVENARKVLITYGEGCCDTAKKRMCTSAFENGHMQAPRDECHGYDSSVMDFAFREKNKHILQQSRGAGYWLWKPYIIYKWLTDDSLEDDNSYIIYSDAGAKVIGDVGHVLRFMEAMDDTYKGVLFFGVGFDQQLFCKRDAFILQDCDRDECYRAMQINAFVAFFRKCEFSRMVVKKWLEDCQDERILTDIPNELGKENLEGFKDHRHDQAVITNVMLSNGWNYDTTNGPILDNVFHHDRFKG